MHGVEQLYPSFQNQIGNDISTITPFVHNLFERIYPYKILQGENSSPISKLLKRYHFSVSENEFPSSLTLDKIEKINENEGIAKLHYTNTNNQIQLKLPIGSGDLSNSFSNYIDTPSCATILGNMIHDHSLHQDICLVCKFLHFNFRFFLILFFFRLEKKELEKVF